MSVDFLSGLLLFGVVLFGVVYLVKEFFWESLSGWFAGTTTRHRPQPPAQPNAHLIGAIGRVVDDGSTSGTLRVRVGGETWRARSVDGGASLPVGTEIEVKSADGLLLDVCRRASAAEHEAAASHGERTEQAGG